jgi:hypothetical protein
MGVQKRRVSLSLHPFARKALRRTWKQDLP